MIYKANFDIALVSNLLLESGLEALNSIDKVR